jgi:phosphoribosylamine--glycine ligase
MRVLVIGAGGREHALAWKIAQSPSLSKLFCAPGNAGAAELGECVDVQPGDTQGLAAFAHSHHIDLTVVGPEAPLAAGIADAFRARGLVIFGPSRSAARIEASKVYAKELSARRRIPTGQARIFDSAAQALEHLDTQKPPIVIKADGLAAGKGVTVCHSVEEARAAVEAALVQKVFGDAGLQILIEEYLEGQEFTLMVFASGRELAPMEPVQDCKPVFDGDRGPNTGGMGCYSPVPFVTQNVQQESVRRIMRPALEALERDGNPYQGILYGGLTLTHQGPKMLEFNCRFGDPEAQVALPRLQDDLVDLLLACVEGKIGGRQISFSAARCVCVVMASAGYPGKYEIGKAIRGLEAASRMKDVIIFHAGTKKEDGQVVTSGGRVLGVVGLGETFARARERAYEAVKTIEFEGAHFRTDIALRAAEEEKECGTAVYPERCRRAPGCGGQDKLGEDES